MNRGKVHKEMFEPLMHGRITQNGNLIAPKLPNGFLK